MRQDAQAALSMLLERDLLDDEQIENDVCNVIIELSKDECSELRTLALTVSIFFFTFFKKNFLSYSLKNVYPNQWNFI